MAIACQLYTAPRTHSDADFAGTMRTWPDRIPGGRAGRIRQPPSDGPGSIRSLSDHGMRGRRAVTPNLDDAGAATSPGLLDDNHTWATGTIVLSFLPGTPPQGRRGWRTAGRDC